MSYNNSPSETSLKLMGFDKGELMSNKETKATDESRRSVLKGLGVGAVVAAVAPHILIAEEAGKDKPVTVGTGEHTYEWIREWAKPPEGTQFGDTHGVQVDSQGRVLVHTNRSKHSVYIYDAAAKLIKSWG